MKRGWVYVLDDRMGHFKIGCAVNLDRRIRQLKILLPFPVIVAYAFETDNPRQVEAMLHQRFADKRLNGEWFALNDNPKTKDYDFIFITDIARNTGIFENIDGTWFSDGVLPPIPSSDEDFERAITDLFEEGLFDEDDLTRARLKRYSTGASPEEAIN